MLRQVFRVYGYVHYPYGMMKSVKARTYEAFCPIALDTYDFEV